MYRDDANTDGTVSATASQRTAPDLDCQPVDLPNGVTVIAHRHDAAPLVAVRIYVRGGSVFEGAFAGSGISHLLEHVVTGDGTQRRSARETQVLSDAIGGLVNAYTDTDHICYHATTTPEHFRDAVELLADWVARPRLSAQVFRRELGVVQRELERDRDDPEIQMEELLNATLYEGHPMQHPIIGHRAILRRLTHADVAAYHDQTHGPENVVVVVTGQIDPAAAIQTVAHAFEGVERRPNRLAMPPDPAPILAPRRALKRMKTGSAGLTLAWQTVREEAIDEAPLDLLCSVLTEGDSARLVRSLRWDRSLVFDISGCHAASYHTPGSFMIFAQFETGRADDVEQAILDGIQQIEREPVKDAELRRAKRITIAGFERQRETAEGLAAQLGEDFLATGSTHATDVYLACIARATAADLARVARQYLSADRRAVAAIVPRAATASSDSSGQNAGIAAPESNEAAAPVARDVSPAHPTSPSRMMGFAKSMHTSAFAAISAAFPGGLSAETEATNGLGNFLAEAMLRGTNRRSAEAISVFFESLGGQIGAAAGLDTFQLECLVPADAFDDAIEVFADVILNPRFDHLELAKLKPAICDAIARQDDDWRGELLHAARLALFGDLPYARSRLGTISNVLRFSRSDLLEAHDRLILDGPGVVSLVGPIDVDRGLERLAAALRMPGVPMAWRNPYGQGIRLDGKLDEMSGRPPMAALDHAAQSRVVLRESDADREVAGLFVGYPGPRITDARDFAAMAVFTAMTVGYALSAGRLFSALRAGDQDLVYEVSPVNIVGRLPGCLSIAAACEPTAVETAYQIISDEIGALCRGEFDDAELDRAKAMIVTAEIERLQTPMDHARRAAEDVVNGLGIENWRAQLAAIQSVTRDDFGKFAAHYIRGPVIVVTTPNPAAVKELFDSANVSPSASAVV